MHDLRLTATDIEEAIRPYVERRLPADSDEWRRIVAASARKQERRLQRSQQATPRSQAEVETAYGRRWQRPLADVWSPKVVPFEWRDEGLLMHSIARRRLNHLLLGRALRATGGRTILEVGAGTGFNLFLLAAQQPALWLAGVELTDGGVAAAASLRAEPGLPTLVTDFSCEPLVDARAHARVRLVRGTAAALPFPDRAFEVVCTVLALEQMESIRAAALAEIRRVSARWVVMVEPFHDLNREGVRADYVRAQNYFKETIDGLAAHGLTPRAVYRDVPNKLTLHVALVVAERTPVAVPVAGIVPSR